MVRLLVIFLLMSFHWLPGNAQPCERLDIQSKKQQKVLKRFIRECKSKGFLTPDSGIIHLSEWVDSQGQINWQISAPKKWRKYDTIAPFRGHCTDCLAPVGWTNVSNKLVLRYNADRSDTLTKAESGCLQELLASHVIIILPVAPPPKERIRRDAHGQPILHKEGRVIMQPLYPDVSAGGGGSNNTHITFKKDGLVKKKLSL
jgi:hypothetical protein